MIISTSEFHRAVQMVRNGTSSRLTVAVHETVDNSLIETVCAFANMPRGGSILIGLDHLGEPGLNGTSELASLETEIHLLAQERIRPSISVEFLRATVEDQSVVIVNVPPVDTAMIPARVATTNLAYIRSEHGNHVLSPSEIQQLQDEPQKAYDLRAVSGSGAEHLDEALVQKFTDAVRHDSELLSQASETEILHSKGVLTSSGELTIAGLYALGRYPQQFFPNLRITAKSGKSATDQSTTPQYFEGPLPVIIENAVRWAIRQTGETVHHSRHADALPRTTIPILAIREVIINALIHRSLSPHALDQSVLLELDNNELTVKSPGGLHKISLEQLGREPSETAVNTSLYEICRYVSVSGKHRIVDPACCMLRDVHWALRRAGLHPPQYLDNGLHFTVMLGRRYELSDAHTEWLATLPHHGKLSPQQHYLLIAMSDGTPWNAETLHREFGPKAAKRALRQLAHLAELGLVQARQTHNSTSYRIAGQWQRDDLEQIGHVVELQPPHEKTPIRKPGVSDDASAGDPPRYEDHDSAARAAAVSKHGATLCNVLNREPMNIHDISKAAKLSLSQTRYGIQRLVSEGLVIREGGQGHRETTYTRTD